MATPTALLNANQNSNLLTYGFETQLLNQWVPRLYFHPDETYFPSSMDFIVANGRIMEKQTDGQFQVAVPNPTNRDMIQYGQKYGFPTFSDQVYLEIPSSIHQGEYAATPDMYTQGAVPAYAYIRDGPNNTLHLTYIFTYPYNGEYPILWLQNAGQHDYDLEHITVELNKTTNQLVRVYYGAHGPADGDWRMADQVPRDPDGKLRVGVALTGHGTYPQTSGAAFRIFGLANDLLGEGLVWNPRVVQIVPKEDPRFNIDTMGWTYFPGRIGKNGTTSLPDKSWYQTSDPEQVKPPRLISQFQLNGFRVIVYGLILLLAYLLFRWFQFLVDRFTDYDKVYRLPEYIGGYLIFAVLTYFACLQIKKVILKYAPS